MKFKMLSLFFLAIVLQTAHGGEFANQYVSFSLPNGWECGLEGSEWVCQHTNKSRRKEAIMILAAKLRGNHDNLTDYMSYLRKVKSFTLPGGKTQYSEPKYTKNSTIHNHPWVDSLHLASEVPGFYTRYLATVKEDLGIAVTFSVAKSHYNEYQGVFDRIVQTLRAFRDKSKGGNYKKSGRRGSILGEGIYDPSGDEAMDLGKQRGRKGGSSVGEKAGTFLFLLLIAAGIGYFIYKKKKGKGKKKTKKKKKS